MPEPPIPQKPGETMFPFPKPLSALTPAAVYTRIIHRPGGEQDNTTLSPERPKIENSL